MENKNGSIPEKIIKDRVTAFSGFLDNGIHWVKKYFPDHVDFVLSNKDKSFPEVIDIAESDTDNKKL